MSLFLLLLLDTETATFTHGAAHVLCTAELTNTRLAKQPKLCPVFLLPASFSSEQKRFSPARKSTSYRSLWFAGWQPTTFRRVYLKAGQKIRPKHLKVGKFARFGARFLRCFFLSSKHRSSLNGDR